MHHLLNATNIYIDVQQNAACSEFCGRSFYRPTISIYKHVKNMDYKGCSSK